MSEKSITFEDLPKAMSWMMDKLNELDSKIDGLNIPCLVRGVFYAMDHSVLIFLICIFICIFICRDSS